MPRRYALDERMLTRLAHLEVVRQAEGGLRSGGGGGADGVKVRV